MKLCHFTILLLLSTLAVSAAQTNQKQKPPGPETAQTPPAKQDMAPVFKPAPEMQKLKFLIGKWATEEKFEPSEFMPKGGSGTGDAEIHDGPGRFSIIQNFHTRLENLGPFTGHALMWWDAKSSQYKSFWCDSMGGCEGGFGSGQWDGDKLVFMDDTESMGQKMTMRQTFSEIKSDSFTWTEEDSIAGGPFKTALTIHYNRSAQ